MRKRLVIGAIVIVAIGVAAYVLSQPKEGTVEWHKDRYLKAQKDLERRTIRDCWERFYVKILKPRTYQWRVISGDELRQHQTALIKLGYLERKRVDVTNHLAGQLHSILAEGRELIPRERGPFATLSAPPLMTSPIEGVEVVAPRQDVPLWNRLIHEADAKIPPDPRPKRSLILSAPDRAPEAVGLDEMFREPRGY